MKRGLNVVELEGVHGLAIRKTVPVAGLPGFFGSAFGQLGEYIGRMHGAVAGPPFATYYSVDQQTADVEAVFPAVFDVIENLPGEGDIHPIDFCAGPALEYVYFGPYDAMTPVYAEIEQWLKSNDKKAAGPPREVYYSEPTGDPANWETHVVQPFG